MPASASSESTVGDPLLDTAAPIPLPKHTAIPLDVVQAILLHKDSTSASLPPFSPVPNMTASESVGKVTKVNSAADTSNRVKLIVPNMIVRNRSIVDVGGGMVG